MLITKNKLDQDSSGILELVAQNMGDLQTISAMITPGVAFGCASTRKIMINQRQERKQVKIVMHVVRAQLDRQTQVISINGTIALSSNPDVPLHTSHQYFLGVGQKFTLSRHWSAQELESLTEQASQQCQALVVLSTGVARLALVGETVEYVDRIECSIPGKDRFNQEKITKATQKFIETTIQAICNKIQPMPLIVAGQQQFVVMLEAKKELLTKYELIFTPTKAFTTRAVIQELISLGKLAQQAWWGVSEALEQIRTNLLSSGLALYSQDVILALSQQPQALEKAYILQSFINNDNSVAKLVSTHSDVVCRVPDYSEPAEVLRSLGGAACKLKYVIWLEHNKEEGKVFTAFDEFEDSQEAESV